MENRKILYSLGSKCTPHCVLQKELPKFTAPSLFAGCVTNQNESDVFIPQLLFDGSFEKHYFGMKNWTVMKKLNDVERQKHGILLGQQDGNFSLFYNHSGRILRNVNPVEFGVEDLTYGRDMIYNENLHILNVHHQDKTPGTNPAYEEYQRGKYDFWVKHRFELEYFVVLGVDTTIQHLENFKEFLTGNGYDIGKIHIFNRFKSLDLSSIGFNIIDISKYYDDILDMRWIAYSDGIITDYAKNILHQRGLC